MDTELLKNLAQSNQWWAIYPELFLGLLALGLLLLEAFLPRRMYNLIPRLAIWGQSLLLAYLLLFDWNNRFLGQETFAGLLQHSTFGQVFRALLLFTSIVVSALALINLERRQLPRVEFFHILLVATAAMMLLVQSNHFVMMFVALETVTVAFFILVSYHRNQTYSLEAGLKYLILGALSSAILLFGIVLLYGAATQPDLAGTTRSPLHFPSLRSFLLFHPTDTLAQVGMVLVLAGLAFKIGAVPFQIWIPDVYQGAPTPVTASLAVASKAAGFGILYPLVHFVFAPLAGVMIPLLSVMTAATLLFGNFAALPQRNTKRLMGLSGISHAGFLLLALLAAVSVPMAQGAFLFYLIAYTLGSLAVFGVMSQFHQQDESALSIDHFRNLLTTQPLLAWVLAAGIGSLAGIPPLAGFIGKVLVFVYAFQAGLFVLLGIALFCVVLSIYYYFSWLKSAFFPSFASSGLEEIPGSEKLEIGVDLHLGGRLGLAALALASLGLGLFQGPLAQYLISF